MKVEMIFMLIVWLFMSITLIIINILSKIEKKIRKQLNHLLKFNLSNEFSIFLTLDNTC